MAASLDDTPRRRAARPPTYRRAMRTVYDTQAITYREDKSMTQPNPPAPPVPDPNPKPEDDEEEDKPDAEQDDKPKA